MKKVLVSLLLAGFFVAGTASAQTGPPTEQAGMMGGYRQNEDGAAALSSAEIGAAMRDIFKAQNISDQSNVDCSKVTDGEFEKLGDAYMGLMLTNQEQHDAMEKVMGGEGSDSLRQAHVNMGRSYLGCWSNYSGAPAMMSMMGGYGFNQGSAMGNYYGNGSGMMGSGFGPGWNLMGGYHWFGWLTMALIWVLLVLGIAALLRWLRK